ncbi:TolC family protein [Porphyrobacter algicida]|uniref:TolC family protein n=1 Tax=Qipengyuania algicida TaxID=1836209 RepID=A0A845AIE2_9SPHN|nr:TolC family protein [Qipengyuania algicida]MXP30030.1 TolC family protein [Qipengyuania algicida]
MRRLMPLIMLSLSGCATYHAVPLSEAPAALATPSPAVLAEAASTIRRPWLAPVKVDLSQPLTQDGLAAIAVINNPDLVAQRAREGVSNAQVFAAGLLPDPTFSFGANKVLTGPDPFLDLSSTLGLDLNALRTRAVSRRVAVANAEKVRLDLAWSEWQTAGQARLQAAKVLSLTQIVGLAKASENITRSLLDRINRAVGRGDISGVRLQAARIALLTASEQLRTSESSLATAKTELRRQLGLPPGYKLDLAQPALPPPPPSTEKLFKLAETNRTDLAALRAGYTSQEATVRKAIIEQFPTLNLNLNAARDSAGNFLLGPSVDFTLPLWNRNRGNIAIERATRTALKAEYNARLFQTRADIDAAEAGLQVAYRRRNDTIKQLPRLQRYAEATRKAAKRGDLSLEAAQNAEQALRDRELVLAQADQTIAEQSIALELLTGTPREAWPQ